MENNNKKALDSLGEEIKGFAWFDFDGTLCAPVFHHEGKTVFGFEDDFWVEFCEKEGVGAYENGVPIEQVIEYARRLHRKGFRLGVLTANSSRSEEIAKCAWLEKHDLMGLFSEVRFVEAPSKKIAFMLWHAAQNGFRPDQIMLVEDLYDTVLATLSAGMVGIHTSHIFTGVVG